MYKQILLLLVISLNIDCSNYKAGNLTLLDYTIDTKLSYEIRRQYLDRMKNFDEYKVPQKWMQYNKLIDINPNTTWRIYFKTNPEEMYLITINSNFVIADVFNSKIVDYDWVSERKRMPENEKVRVIERAKREILDRIEKMAKDDGCPDSVLYFKAEYINNKWTTAPKWPN